MIFSSSDIHDPTAIAKKADIVISKILKHIEEDGCTCCKEAKASD